MSASSGWESAAIVASEDLLTTDFGDEVVMLDLRDGIYYSLAGTGARIWQLLQQPTTMAAVSDAIASEYEVDRPRCIEDVRELIDTFVARGLVQVREGL